MLASAPFSPQAACVVSLRSDPFQPALRRTSRAALEPLLEAAGRRSDERFALDLLLDQPLWRTLETR